ncbi:MAG: TRAP transporter small permease [Pseudomonadota bacterium]
MRKALDTLYRASGIVAAVFLLAIAVTVLIQVGLNILDRIAVALTGTAVGLTLPSYAEFTGYFLTASTFFAGAYALKAGAHIRVTLVLQRLSPEARRRSELVCAVIGAVFAAYFTGWVGLLAWESWVFGDVSPGIVPVPIWIPQLSMVIGLLILTIALIDEAVVIARSGTPGRGAACDDDLAR